MIDEPDLPDVQPSGHRVRRGVTLIATVLNERASVASFLDGLSRQSVHPEEIVIVDGGSTDGTAEALEGWRPACGCRVRVIVEAGAGISAGRNIAIAAASAPIIAVTDAGAELRPDWLERMTEPLSASTSPDVVSGFFEPTGRTFRERAIAATITPTAGEIDPDAFMPSSRSVLFRREAWARVGGYPEWLDYCEDLVFDFALKESGARFVFQPRAIARWIGRPTLSAFAKQYYRYARGDGKAALFPRRHLARYLAYTYALASALLVVKAPVFLIVGAGGFIVYMVTPIKRVLARRGQFSGIAVAAALLLSPIVVVTGDMAKMAGYPAGRVWRRRHRDRVPS